MIYHIIYDKITYIICIGSGVIMKKGKLKYLCIVIIGAICMIVILIIKNKPDDSPVIVRSIMEVTDSSRYIEPISDNVTVEKDIVYSEVVNYKGESVQLTLDVYQPENDLEVNRPAIIWIHGGGFTNGSKDASLFEKDLAIDFAKKGYVTLDINYRLRDGLTTSQESYSALEDAVADAAAAYKWLQENSEVYGIDKNYIAFAGYSAGAATAINLCYSDFTKYGIDKSGVLGVVDMAGGYISLGSVKKGDPACIIIQGTKDETVPLSNSMKLSGALNKKEINCVFYQLENYTHDLTLRFDDISNQITMFLYKQLTNKDIIVTVLPEKSYVYKKVDQRIANEPVYHAKQIELSVDGNLEEWGDSERITLNQLKDVGTTIPRQDDFAGIAMVGWNAKDPKRVYIAAVITDDTIQDVNDAEDKWFNDDCVEIIFDLSKDNIASQLTKWVVGATGNDLSKLANSMNTELKIVKKSNTYYYEMGIDITDIDKGISDANTNFEITPNAIIGFSIAYNDCENNMREHQIGWTAGISSDRATFGNLQFVADTAKTVK